MEDIKEIMKTFKAIDEGIRNYHNPKPEIEALALKRYNESDILVNATKGKRFVDKRIPQLSNKMVKGCSCIARYYFRQSIIINEQWEK